MRYHSILIITYARSGSTLLQGLLNAIPNCVIRGENDNLFFHLFRAYQSLLSTQKDRDLNRLGDCPKHPWFGYSGYSVDEFLELVRQYAVSLLLGNVRDRAKTVYGFKEIRYRNPEVLQVFDQYMQFLGRVFPEVAMICNVRDHQEVAASGWHPGLDQQVLRENLAQTDRAFRAYAENHDNCFLIDYRDVVTRSERLRAMYSFLGAEYDEAVVRQVLATTHSYASRPAGSPPDPPRT